MLSILYFVMLARTRSTWRKDYD